MAIVLMDKPDQLVLASASPRRKAILEAAGLRFRICPANADEFHDDDAEPGALVHHNALLKARAIAPAYPASLVLGVDTTVCLDYKILGKPADMDEARDYLRSMSGRKHEVYTGVAMIWMGGGLEEIFVSASQVQFKSFDDALIDQYFAKVNPLDKAGAYGIQEGADLIIDHFEGSRANIMGLPIEALCDRLEALSFLAAFKNPDA